ncbi:MAG: thiamine pyrophosphate-dependent enzyme [Spirochaetia bacterium]
MSNISYLNNNTEIAWCPGCGNFAIRKTMDKVYQELGIDKKKFVMVSGIGQAPKSPHYLDVSFFNGLHGRSLPTATGIKLANPELTVVVESGDGNVYGEGGNHFLHALRRDIDVTVIVHNNMVYGLTKGQASPTSRKGFQTPVQTTGVLLEPFNPLATALGLKGGFVARANAADAEQTKEIIKAAIQHKGFSLVDLFQVCVSFNKTNDYKWFKDHTYYLEDDYKPDDRMQALQRAMEEDPMPLGIFFRQENDKSFHEKLPAYSKDNSPLYRRKVNFEELNKIMDEFV